MSSLYKVTHDERETIGKFIDSKINQINTTLIAKVDEISENDAYITVSPLSKRVYIDEKNERQTTDFPQIMVRLICQKGFLSQIETGDIGVLLVIQSDVDFYFGGSSNYIDRRFDLIDALFIPLEKTNQNTEEVKIKTSQYIKIQNENFDLVSLMKSIANTCKQISVNESGNLNPGLVADFQEIETKIESFIKS